MPARKRRLAAVALVLIAVLALFGWLSRPPRPRYTVTDLGVLPGVFMSGTPTSNASGINAQGDVVGLSGGQRIDKRHAFLYRGGVMTDLGPSGLITSHDGPVINDSGQITGVLRVTVPLSASGSGRQYHAFLYGAGGMRDLGTPPGYSMSMGNGINSHGQVVYEAWSDKPGAGAYMSHAFLCGGRTMDIGVLPGCAEATPTGINAAGQVVGYSEQRIATGTQAFVYDSRTRKMTALATPPGFLDGFAAGINDRGQIIGTVAVPNRKERAVFWAGGRATDLGALPGMDEVEGAAVNNRGEAVGLAYAGQGTVARFVNDHPLRLKLLLPLFGQGRRGHRAAFLYRAGRMEDLNTLIPARSGWVLQEAQGINDRGQIVGTGWHHGQNRMIGRQGHQGRYCTGPLWMDRCPFNRHAPSHPAQPPDHPLTPPSRFGRVGATAPGWVLDIPPLLLYTLPSTHVSAKEFSPMKEVTLIASGDLRLSANQMCQEAQAAMEKQVVAAFQREGATVKRGHLYDPAKKHGFIDSQKYGMEVFRKLDPETPLVVAEAVWQYSHHVLPGLSTHKGPILTLANWSGTWPGLVGMLNLNGSLTKAGVPYSTLWSEDFEDGFFTRGLRCWLRDGRVRHNTGHVHAYDEESAPPEAVTLGGQFAQALQRDKAIMGVFDEGCMGMFNAIIPDDLLHRTGVFKERLSQSSLYAKMQTVPDAEARAAYQWILDRGMTFQFGPDPEADLTEAQVLGQCKMYIAALRIADEFGCAAIGIQYQQGMKDLAPASDLVEGLLNNVERPPVKHETTGRELYAGAALPHFNEVDECAGLDALVTNRLWKQLGFPPETTLHDLRWGRQYTGPDQAGNAMDDYVWVFEISGAVPPAHFEGGYKGATGERQPPMYFAQGGSTLKGVSRPGWVVWSRVFVEGGVLKYDTGLAESVALPQAETEDRWALTTPQWPVMHAVLKDITRDQMMARHKANHIQVAYAPDEAGARHALHVKAAAMSALGLAVSLCGEIGA